MFGRPKKWELEQAKKLQEQVPLLKKMPIAEVVRQCRVRGWLKKPVG